MAILQAQNLTKVYPSGSTFLTVLDNVSLTLEKGESLAIAGPSGSGKSTLLGLLAGLEKPTQGRVTLLGQDLGVLTESELSKIWGKKLGFIFQSYRLIPTLSALENTRIPLDLAGVKESQSIARQWLERVGLKDRARHLPGQLSGGEQQRVALARALAPAPEILFADEPTGNLDGKTGKEMSELLFRLVQEQKTSLVLVTHETSLASRTNRILHLEDGGIVREN